MRGGCARRLHFGARNASSSDRLQLDSAARGPISRFACGLSHPALRDASWACPGSPSVYKWIRQAKGPNDATPAYLPGALAGVPLAVRHIKIRVPPAPVSAAERACLSKERAYAVANAETSSDRRPAATSVALRRIG